MVAAHCAGGMRCASKGGYDMSNGDTFPSQPFEAVLGPIPQGAPRQVAESLEILWDLVELDEIPLTDASELGEQYIHELSTGRPRAGEVVTEEEWMQKYVELRKRRDQGRLL